MVQINLKQILIKILQWIQNPLKAHGTANTDCFYLAKRTDTGTQVGFGVGSGGVNHGVYSHALGKWLIYGDASTVYVNGVQMRKTQVTVTKSGSAWTAGNITAYYNNGTMTVQFSNVSIGTISARTTVATIPAGYRPPAEAYGKANNSNYTGTLIVQNNGNIQVDAAFSGKTSIYATITYAQWA